MIRKTLVSDRYKYPSTKHVPWSDTVHRDDSQHSDLDFFIDKKVVVTCKMDGENTNLYRDFFHARSIDSENTPNRKQKEVRSWVKQFHASIAHLIPDDWRISGENMFAKHAIHYKNLSSYFLTFAVWNEMNECLSWNDTVSFCSDMGLSVVPLLYIGKYDEKHIKSLYYPDMTIGGDPVEGYVIRTALSYLYDDHEFSTAKYVRAGHVQQGSEHWLYEKTIPNIIG